MSIVITGDTHGTFDIGKVVRYFNEHEDEYTRDDYLIICGDVGICGFSAAYEANTRAVFRSLPVTTLFIDGNHENFEQLNSYAVEQWNGGKVHIIADNMIHLMRGQIFTIDGLKFFTFGGAYSIDKMSRAEGISWFPEEIPSREEYEEGWKNLEKEDFQVDYILTHTAPRDVAKYTDVFYIGGTKVGALFGEAVVITNQALKKDFRYMIKQNGGMLAKGRLLGIQFDTLFTDDLYFKISAHADELAMKLKKIFLEKGYGLRYDSYTNQQFPILPDSHIEKLKEKYVFEFWEKVSDTESAVRFCTSWATKPEVVDELIKDIMAC